MITAHILDASGIVINSIVLADDSDPAQFGAVFGPKSAGIGWSHNGADWSAPAGPITLPPSLEDLRAAKMASITATSTALLFAGAPTASGLHIALDDGSRADLTAMAATATAASAGAISWPESYARGWITIENIRLPLTTPAAGLALAASVGDYYAAIVQHRRDLKDATLAAVDEVALEAIDAMVGWPAS